MHDDGMRNTLCKLQLTNVKGTPGFHMLFVSFFHARLDVSFFICLFTLETVAMSRLALNAYFSNSV